MWRIVTFVCRTIRSPCLTTTSAVMSRGLPGHHAELLDSQGGCARLAVDSAAKGDELVTADDRRIGLRKLQGRCNTHRFFVGQPLRQLARAPVVVLERSSSHEGAIQRNGTPRRSINARRYGDELARIKPRRPHSTNRAYHYHFRHRRRGHRFSSTRLVGIHQVSLVIGHGELLSPFDDVVPLGFELLAMGRNAARKFLIEKAT